MQTEILTGILSVSAEGVSYRIDEQKSSERWTDGRTMGELCSTLQGRMGKGDELNPYGRITCNSYGLLWSE